MAAPSQRIYFLSSNLLRTSCVRFSNAGRIIFLSPRYQSVHFPRAASCRPDRMASKAFTAFCRFVFTACRSPPSAACLARMQASSHWPRPLSIRICASRLSSKKVLAWPPGLDRVASAKAWTLFRPLSCPRTGGNISSRGSRPAGLVSERLSSAFRGGRPVFWAVRRGSVRLAKSLSFQISQMLTRPL